MYTYICSYVHTYFPTVISQPDDVTICEGEGVVFTCVLNNNIRSDDVQWYRFIKDTSITVMVDPNGGNIYFYTHTNGNTTSSSLTITNAIKSYTGYFWVGTPSLNVCNASFTIIGTRRSIHYSYSIMSTYVRMFVQNYQYLWLKYCTCYTHNSSNSVASY